MSCRLRVARKAITDRKSATASEKITGSKRCSHSACPSGSAAASSVTTLTNFWGPEDPPCAAGAASWAAGGAACGAFARPAPGSEAATSHASSPSAATSPTARHGEVMIRGHSGDSINTADSALKSITP